MRRRLEPDMRLVPVMPCPFGVECTFSGHSFSVVVGLAVWHVPHHHGQTTGVRMARRPPDWPRHTDQLAKTCRVEPLTFGKPIPPMTWCHYCEMLATTRDHIVPDSVGGARLWWNLVPSCAACNLQKADRQSCSCMFCLRAMALWSLGFRREGKSYRDKKNNRKPELRARETLAGLTPGQVASLAVPRKSI